MCKNKHLRVSERMRSVVTDSMIKTIHYDLIFKYLQVQVLLKECEEARGGVVSSETVSMHPMSSAEVTSSSQVISEHLVTFRLVGSWLGFSS